MFLALLISPALLAQTSMCANQAAPALAAEVCAGCHGLRGDSPNATVPRLAAQRVSYLTAEILNFKTHDRSEIGPHRSMQSPVVGIDDETALALAQYYARQPAPPAVPGDPVRMARGKALFEHGNEKQAACIICHGQRAEGDGIFPRLAGQHAPYLAHQLKAKEHDPGDKSIMHGMLNKLTADDIADLADYLASISDDVARRGQGTVKP